MKPDGQPTTPGSGSLAQIAQKYEETTGRSITVWAVVAFLAFVAQAVFFGQLWNRPGQVAGEFGLLNSALGVVGLLAIPVATARLALRLYPAHASGIDSRASSLRDSSVTIIETFAWAWCACCFVLVLVPLPLPSQPRFSLELLTLVNVLLVLGGCISATICESDGHRRQWTILLVAAAITRIVLGGWLTAYQPSAETVLAIFLVAGFITVAPALRPRDIDLMARLKACVKALNRDFLHFAAATFSVLLGVYLFTNADRIAALSWMNIDVQRGILPNSETQSSYDTYQATGLLARAILWGTQPLLWALYADRSKLNKTTPASLKFFWIYLGALFIGTFLLWCVAQMGSHNLSVVIGKYGPTFAAIMVPLGILQGLAIFSLSSRRYPECFAVGGCGVVYALVLAFFGHRPDIMLPYMFGAALVSLMVVLFIGVVRWGRKQP